MSEAEKLGRYGVKTSSPNLDKILHKMTQYSKLVKKGNNNNNSSVLPFSMNVKKPRKCSDFQLYCSAETGKISGGQWQ